jgi:hypothetical protein
MKFDDANDLRKDFPRFTPEALEANFKLVDFLRDFAGKYPPAKPGALGLEPLKAAGGVADAAPER